MLYCNDVELLLQDYLDGYLLSSQREVLENHVRGCDACRALLSGIARVDDRLECIGEVEAPARLSSAILNALPPGSYGPSRLQRAVTYGLAPILLAAVVGFGLLLKGRYVAREELGAREIEISLSFPQAAKVAVVGDFNGWDPHRTPMARAAEGGRWRTHLRLQPGVYQYSFVIDDTTWIRDPKAKSTLADGFGGENSIMVVDG